MFRRRRQADDLDELDGEVGEDGSAESSETPVEAVVTPPARPRGPWDAHDLPDDDEVPRIDLGSLAVPVPEGLEVRVDVQDDTVVAATLVDEGSALQIHAFAAPRSGGLWDEVRDEIAASLRETSGSAQDVETDFGVELHAQVPEDDHTAPARFLGVDGPRWFLRGMISGPAATEPARAGRLEAAFRDVVVTRGTEAMAPRDMLPLRLPREAVEQMAETQADEASQPDPRHLEVFERGPEITEIQ